MKSFDTELKKYAEKISLKAAERDELRNRVLSYMEYHPLPKQAFHTKDVTQVIPAESFVVFHFNSLYARIAGGVFVLLLIIAPFVAERSVPGDSLYFLKTGFNETIQGQLASTPYEKIEFQTKLIERRISEARVLASEGKLTEEVKTQIAVDVKDHTDAVQAGLAEIRTKDADGAAIAEIAFNSSLEVQSAVLSTNESTNSTSSIDSILTVVNDARDVVASNQVDTAPSFEGLSARIELETTRAYELFNTVKVSATPEEITDMERRLSDVDRLILEAKAKNATDTEGAASDLATTLGLIQKLIVFMTNIDVRESVTLESLVPVVLSDAERTDFVNKEVHDIQGLQMEIVGRLASTSDVGIKEKVKEGLVQVKTLIEKATTTIANLDIDSAESAIHEARALITDLNTLTLPPETPKTDPVVTSTISEGDVGTSTASSSREEATSTDVLSTEDVISE